MNDKKLIEINGGVETIASARSKDTPGTAEDKLIGALAREILRIKKVVQDELDPLVQKADTSATSRERDAAISALNRVKDRL